MRAREIIGRIVLPTLLAVLVPALTGVLADPLTVEDGVVVKFDEDGELVVRDGLTIDGGVLFTSTEDDSAAGALFPAPGSPAAGDWLGVLIEASASNPSTFLEGLRIRYAGAAGAAALTLRGTTTPLSGFTVEDSANAGLLTLSPTSSALSEMALRRNGVGILIELGSTPTLGTSLIEQNMTGALSIDTAAAIAAENNWWGHPSGPLDDSDDTGSGGLFNPEGLGNPVGDGIDYDPFSAVVPLFGLGFSLPEGDLAGDREVEVELRGPTATAFRLSEDPTFAGVPFQPMTDRTTFTLSEGEGLKTVHAEFQAPTGNTASLSRQVRLDFSGPMVTVLAPLPGALLQRPITVMVEAIDPAGVPQVEFLVDGNIVAVDTTNDFSFDWDIRQETPGAHELGVRAADGLGRATLVLVPVTISPAPPLQPQILSPASGTMTAAGTIDIVGQAEATTNVTIVRGVNTVVASLIADAAGGFMATVPLEEGLNSFTATAADLIGVSLPSTPVEVIRDTGAPDAPILVASLGLDGRVQLQWTQPANEIPIAYRVWRSNAFFADTSQATFLQNSILTVLNDTPPSDGTWYYGVTALDPLNNESALSNVESVTIDVTPPTATVATSPVGPVGPGTIDVTVTVSEPVDGVPFLNITPLGGTTDNIDLTSAGGNDWTGQYTVVASTPTGTAVFGFSGTDVAGNTGTAIVAGGTLEIDTQGPQGTVTTIPAGTVGPGTVAVTLDLDEAAPSAPALRFLPPVGGPVVVALAGGPTSWTGDLEIVDAMGDGAGSFEYDATDTLGNAFSGPASGPALILDTTPVGVPTGLDAISRPAGEIDLSWSPVADAVAYALYRLPAADTFPSAAQQLLDGGIVATEYTDLPPTDGAYRYAVASRDGLGNESGLSMDVVAVSDRLPPADPADVTAVLEGNAARVSWNAPGAGAMDRYRIFRETAPFAAVDGLTPVVPDQTETTLLDVPPADGDFYYGVVAVDLAGNVSGLATAAVFTFDQGAPVITVAGVVDGLFSNVTVTPTFSATDLALQSVDATLNGNPFASGTPVSAEGAYVLVVTASDTTGNTAETTISFVIDTTPPTIEVTGVTDGGDFETAVTPVFTVDDLNLDSVVATLNGAPFASGTAIATDDSYTLVIDAVDLAGNAAQTTVQFDVDAPPAPPASLDVEVDTTGFPILSWPAGPEADIVGYRVKRNSLVATPTPIATTQYTDSGFNPAVANVYRVSTVDAGGHESAPIVATVRRISLALDSYGQEIEQALIPVFNPVGGTNFPAPDPASANVLTRRYLDQVTVSMVNNGFAMVTPGALTMRLRDATSILGERIVPASGPLAPGGGARQISRIFNTGPSSGSGNARLLELEVALPSEPGTTVRLTASHTLLVRNNPPPLQIFSDPLVRGATANVRVKVLNHGSVPIEVITSENEAPTADVEVRLLDSAGTVLSSARLDDRSARTVVTLDKAFAIVPVGGSYLSTPIGLQIPSSAPDNVKLEAVVVETHSSVLSPDDVTGSLLRRETPITIGDPPYLADAQTDQDVYDQGDPVTITGGAFDQSRAPVPNSPVKVGISTRGFARTVTTTTDAAGAFEVTFNPFATEAGSYTVWATHPTVTEEGAQDQFDILGLLLTPRAANVRFSRNGSLTFPVRLKNNGELPIADLIPDLVGGNGISGSVDLADVPLPLQPGKTGTMRVTVNATPTADIANFATLTLTSPEGAVRVFDINIALLEAIPVISTTPSFVDVGVSIGNLVARNVRVRNVGFAPLDGITIDDPTLPWISLGVDSAPPPIPPGGFADVTVVFNPDATVDQGVYADSIVIRSGNHIPFTVNLFATVTSAERGAVEFLVKNIEDVVVPGARVAIRSTKVPDLQFNARADDNGMVLFEDLPAGPYEYKIQATGHNVVVDSFTVQPNTVLPLTVFLPVAYVTLEWSVTPIVIEDRYDLVLTATFETQVPAPVLTADPPFFRLTLAPGGIFAGTITVTNHGLIAADDVVISVGSSDQLLIETLIQSIPRIPAMGSAEIPFRVTLDEDAPVTNAELEAALAEAAISSGPSTPDGAVDFQLDPRFDPPQSSPTGIGACLPTYSGSVNANGTWFCPAGFTTGSGTGSGMTVTPPDTGCGGCTDRCAPCSCLGVIPGIGGTAKGVCECLAGLTSGCADAGTACTCLGTVSDALGAACDCLNEPDILTCLGPLAEGSLADALDAIDNLSDAFNCGFELGICLLQIEVEGGTSSFSGGGGGQWSGGWGGGGGGISSNWGCD